MHQVLHQVPDVRPYNHTVIAESRPLLMVYSDRTKVIFYNTSIYTSNIQLAEKEK